MAWLVGLSVEVSPVLPRALKWLDAAIEKDESFGQDQNFHRTTLRMARAMGKWMLTSLTEAADWRNAAASLVDYWSSPQWSFSPAKIVRDVLDDYMAFCVQAGMYDQAIEMYEGLVGNHKSTLAKVPKPREYAYAVSVLSRRGQLDEETVFEAGRRMLQANIEDNWLGRGQALRAAMWLKIVYWDRDVRADRTPLLTPLQTVLMAYENMPNVKRPDFI